MFFYIIDNEIIATYKIILESLQILISIQTYFQFIYFMKSI